MTAEQRIAAIRLEDSIVLRSREIEHDIDKAIGEIKKHGSFGLSSQGGACELSLGVAEKRLMISVFEEGQSEALDVIPVPLLPFRRLVKDYEMICDSYHQAIENAIDPTKVEAIDMGRRGLHNEGAEVLQDLVDGKVDMDFETARQFFTLIYVLHLR